MNWKMIPFTRMPEISEMTRLEINVRAALLGVIAGCTLAGLFYIPILLKL